jgi:thioredoxin 1
MMLSVNEQDFAREVLQCSQPVLVNFWAPWCGICRLINPTLLKFGSRSSGQIKLVSINADESLKLANTYRLTSLPTLVLFERGVLIERIEGFQGRDDLERHLDRLLSEVCNLSPIAR